MNRIITGLLTGTAWLLLLFYGPFPLFWFVLFIIGGMALNEYCNMVTERSAVQTRHLIFLPSVTPLLLSYFASPAVVGAAIIGALLLLAAFTLIHFPHLADAFDSMSRSAFGLLLIGFCGSHLVLLRALPDGVNWLLWLSALTVASDTGAYYSGKMFGKTKLCPAVSPGKTVEGFAGGLLAGILAVLVVTKIFFTEPDIVKLLFSAGLLCCVGVLGDLTESMIKRSIGVKDSGTIMPGHGGILDRADSILITAPALYYLVYFGVLTGS